jgi:hypothetical protein
VYLGKKGNECGPVQTSCTGKAAVERNVCVVEFKTWRDQLQEDASGSVNCRRSAGNDARDRRVVIALWVFQGMSSQSQVTIGVMARAANVMVSRYVAQSSPFRGFGVPCL